MISVYEEQQLLKNLNSRPELLKSSLFARQLKRKLVVRQAKRDRGLKVFDIDEDYKRLSGIVDTPESNQNNSNVSHPSRILDRYQVRPF